MKWGGRPVYAIRKIDKKNFNPMVHHMIDRGSLKGYVQVFIDVTGGQAWANVRESEVKQ